MTSLGPLALLVAGMTLTCGFLLGLPFVSRLHWRREAALTTERAALNAVWHYLRVQHDIRKPDWVTHILDSEHEGEHRPEQER